MIIKLRFGLKIRIYHFADRGSPVWGEGIAMKDTRKFDMHTRKFVQFHCVEAANLS